MLLYTFVNYLIINIRQWNSLIYLFVYIWLWKMYQVCKLFGMKYSNEIYILNVFK